MITHHLLSPGVSSSQVGGGGVPFFRGVASLLSNVGQVRAYELGQDVEPSWRHDNVEIVGNARPEELLRELLGSVCPGDKVVKASGALPGRWDMVADIELAWLRSRTQDVRLVYVDIDAPSRLPILQYPGTYLDRVLPVADAVLVCGGGPRAAHAYRNLTSSPVVSLTIAVAWFGMPVMRIRPSRVSVRDVVAVYGGDRVRNRRVATLLAAFVRAGLSVAFAGRDLGRLPREVEKHGFLDGAQFTTLVASSRFSLSLLRDDVAGFSDTHPCRMVEAAHLGSMLVAEPFPGLARLFVPGRDIVILDSNPDVIAKRLVTFDERDRREATRRARDGVEAVPLREGRVLVELVTVNG